MNDFPEVDNLRSGRLWVPLIDAVGWNLYKIPGRDISPHVQFQFIDGERMRNDEYDLLIKNPAEFIFERILPRVFNDFKERGSMRSYIAFLKGGMAVMMGNLMRNRAQHLEKEWGMPLPMAGSIPDSTFILGTPDDVRERVKLLCTTLGKEGGYIINGGCSIPYDTKPENYRAMIDGVLEYGRYSDTIHFEPQINPNPPEGWMPPPEAVITPWEDKLKELGGVIGDKTLIRESWEKLEHMAFIWLWTWLW